MNFTGHATLDTQHLLLLDKLDDIIYISENKGNFAAIKLMYSDFQNMLTEHINYEHKIFEQVSGHPFPDSKIYQKYTKIVGSIIIPNESAFYQNIKCIRITLTAYINLESEFFKKHISPTQK